MTDAHFIPDELATRTARLINEAEDMRAQAVDDLKTIYGDLREELKALGWLGQNISKEVAAFKSAISEMRLDEEQKAKREEKGDRIDDYVALLSRSRAGARARTREGNAYADAKLVETVAAGVQTEIGRAALIAAVDIMIEREEQEIATASQGETESPSAEAEAAGAKAGGEDVDRSAERADINAVASASGPDEKRASNSPEQAEFHAKASDDACEAGRKALGRAEASAEAPDGAELVSRGVADRAATATSENGRDSLERQAPSSTAKPKYALRPHCLNPGETCGGYGDKHCHGCLKAMREQAEEVA